MEKGTRSESPRWIDGCCGGAFPPAYGTGFDRRSTMLKKIKATITFPMRAAHIQQSTSGILSLSTVILLTHIYHYRSKLQFTQILQDVTLELGFCTDSSHIQRSAAVKPKMLPSDQPRMRCQLGSVLSLAPATQDGITWPEQGNGLEDLVQTLFWNVVREWK